MKIPSILYGRAGAVKSRAKKKLKGLVEKGAFEDIDFGPFIDTGEIDGLLLIDPERIQFAGEHFHCYALSSVIPDLVPATHIDATMNAWIQWSLKEPWRFLGAAGKNTALYLGAPLFKSYVDAAVRFWPELKAQGNRFGPFVNEPNSAWQAIYNLRTALFNLGIAVSELQEEPPGGPTDFVARINEGSRGP